MPVPSAPKKLTQFPIASNLASRVKRMAPRKPPNFRTRTNIPTQTQKSQTELRPPTAKPPIEKFRTEGASKENESSNINTSTNRNKVLRPDNLLKSKTEDTNSETLENDEDPLVKTISSNNISSQISDKQQTLNKVENYEGNSQESRTESFTAGETSQAPSNKIQPDPHHTTTSPSNPNPKNVSNIPVEAPIEVTETSHYELVIKSYEILRDRRGQWYRVPLYSCLGDGMYGKVFEVKQNDVIYAAKFIYLNDKNNPHMLSADVLREVSLYRDLNDLQSNTFPHLPKFYGFKAKHHFSPFFAEKYLHKCRRCAVLIMEKCDQSFRQYMMLNSKKITLNWIRFYIWQLLNGLARLHSQNLTHRDLKPDNLLVTKIKEDNVDDELENVRLLKISDLGMGRKLRQGFSLDNAGANGIIDYSDDTINKTKRRRLYNEDEMPQTGIVITLPYRPPELLLADTSLRDSSGSHVAFYGKACDMWSVGVIFAELCLLPTSEAKYWKYLFYSRKYQGNYHGKLLMMLTNICKLLGSPNPDEYEHFEKIAKKNWETLGPYMKSFPLLSDLERLYSLEKSVLFHEGVKLDYYGLDLLVRLLQFNPSKRLSAKDALAHPFFESLPYDKMNDLGFTNWMSQLTHPTLFRYLKPYSQKQLRNWQSNGFSLTDTQLALRIHQLPLKTIIPQNNNKRRLELNENENKTTYNKISTSSQEIENRPNNYCWDILEVERTSHLYKEQTKILTHSDDNCNEKKQKIKL